MTHGKMPGQRLPISNADGPYAQGLAGNVDCVLRHPAVGRQFPACDGDDPARPSLPDDTVLSGYPGLVVAGERQGPYARIGIEDRLTVQGEPRQDPPAFRQQIVYLV